ncbi:MAG TPA: hypothetical protein DG754_10735 [Bacteroidales bacterium]|jgi:hypothetical protein|nr:hypothetical protein [Bacteroidales bacterium]
MKKGYFILLLVFAVKLANGQDYEPIVDTTKMWTMFSGSSDAPPGTGQTYALKIKDSVLLADEIYWHKLLESWDENYSTWSTKGYIRENNKMVFYQDKEFSGIDTLYNFNLEVGDTIFNEYDYLYVENISSEFFCGKYRKTYTIGGYSGLKYYEGIGSQYGLLEPHYYFIIGEVRNLVCYYKNKEMLYLNPAYDDCYFNNVSSINASTENDKYKIYPNPSNGFLILEIADYIPNSEYELMLFNSSGSILRNFKINSAHTRINTSLLSKGFYLYSLISLKKTIKTGTLIIN